MKWGVDRKSEAAGEQAAAAAANSLGHLNRICAELGGEQEAGAGAVDMMCQGR